MTWTAAVAAILQGMSSSSADKSAGKRSKKDRQHDFRTMAFQSELVDNLRRRERSEKARGWDNFYTDDKPNRDVGAGPNLDEWLRGTK